VVGDVAASLGVQFRRLSYRALAAIIGEEVREEPPKESRSRRRRRGGRRGRRDVAPMPAPPSGNGVPSDEGHTAPHDELLAVARELLAGAPERTVSIDALSNALKAHGFRRTPGSPRLITRLRRIKELDVARNGAIRLVEESPGGDAPMATSELGDALPEVGETREVVGATADPGAGPPARRGRARAGARARPRRRA